MIKNYKQGHNKEHFKYAQNLHIKKRNPREGFIVFEPAQPAQQTGNGNITTVKTGNISLLVSSKLPIHNRVNMGKKEM